MYLLIESFRRYAINFGEIEVQHHFVLAYKVNTAFKCVYRNERLHKASITLR